VNAFLRKLGRDGFIHIPEKDVDGIIEGSDGNALHPPALQRHPPEEGR